MLAAQAGTGVTQEGSPLLVDEATVREIALASARKLHGGSVRASRLEDDASLQGMKADYAETAGYLNAGKSLMSGFGKFKAGGGFGFSEA
jgi:hypothetical protein